MKSDPSWTFMIFTLIVYLTAVTAAISFWGFIVWAIYRVLVHIGAA